MGVEQRNIVGILGFTSMKDISQTITMKNTIPNALDDIKIVETEDAFNASNGILYSMAEFGRDERQLAVDALIFDPTISKKVVKALVKRQAWKRNDITEAQPGKFHHEHRQLIVGGKEIPEACQEILFDLSKRWGGKENKVTYYGSYDITPDAVSLIADVAKLDTSILSEKVKNEDKGKFVSIKESARQGIQWVQDRILYGPTKTPHNDIVGRFLQKNNLTQFVPTYHHHVLHSWDILSQKFVPRIPLTKKKRIKLLEFQRVNGTGIAYQGWMDGGTSLIHTGEQLDGILADYSQPIATTEAQASAYDALIKASFLFPKKEKHFTKLAHEIRDNVLKHFWMEEKQYFGMGVDRNKKGNLRLITTLGANAGELLNSSFFEDLPSVERQKYIGAIVTMLFSDEFLTPAGIRTRAKSLAYLSDISQKHNQPNTLSDYWDYQGSETSWIVQTGRIAEGLRRQGFYKLCEQLENRILNTVHICGYNLEYVYIGARGDLENVIAYNIQEKDTPIAAAPKTTLVEIAATNIPEFIQTWTASKVAAIKHRRATPQLQPQTEKKSWQYDLEENILATLHAKNQFISAWENPDDILAARNNGYLFIVNKKRGKELEQELVRKSESFHKNNS